MSSSMPDAARWPQSLRAAAASLHARVALRSVDALGTRPRVAGSPFVDNLGQIAIGDDLTLSSRPTRSHLVAAPSASIRIGDRVSVGAGAAISAQCSVTIGDDVRLGERVLVMDADYHAASDRNHAGRAAPIVIEPEVVIGDDVTITRGAFIGRGARVRDGSVVSGIVPAGAVVAGNPARITAARRGGLAGRWDDLEGRVDDVLVDALALAAHLGRTTELGSVPTFDSLAALRVLVSLEDAFGVSLPDNTITPLSTPRELAGAIADCLART